MREVLNALPVVLLIGGLAVLTFGLLPRLTVAVPPTTLAGIMIQVTD
jgi:putative exporter of polyketide antibiotics